MTDERTTHPRPRLFGTLGAHQALLQRGERMPEGWVQERNAHLSPWVVIVRDDERTTVPDNEPTCGGTGMVPQTGNGGDGYHQCPGCSDCVDVPDNEPTDARMGEVCGNTMTQPCAHPLGIDACPAHEDGDEWVPVAHPDNRWTYEAGDSVGLPGMMAWFKDGEPVEEDEVLAALNGPTTDHLVALVEQADAERDAALNALAALQTDAPTTTTAEQAVLAAAVAWVEHARVAPLSVDAWWATEEDLVTAVHAAVRVLLGQTDTEAT